MTRNRFQERDVSASLDRRSENVRVLPIVVAELELGNVERHIFAAHFVERADYAALEDRPEAFDGLCVDCTDDILAFGMINDAVRIFAVKTFVACPLIGAKQADSVRDGFADERGKSIGGDVRDYARDHIAIAADCADDWRFAGADAASSAATATFIPMPVFGQAADESFIDFDDSAQLVDILHQRNADAMAHIPSCFQGTKAHVTPNLPSAYSFLAGKHQVNNTIPIAERLIGVFENGSGDMGEAIAVWRAFFALPMPFARWQVIYSRVATTRATDALRPAARDQVSLAGLFVWKQFLELRDCQLVDLRWLLCTGHDLSSECVMICPLSV
jgi:hypothetical protein